jgi:transposase
MALNIIYKISFLIMYPETWTGHYDRMLCQWKIAKEVRREEMSTQRKRYSAEFKARVALEALKGHKTVNELASTYGVHPTQIAHWKHRLHKEMPDIFSARRAKREDEHEALQAQLYQQIGQLKVELDWLKKKAGLAT